ncbi:MAG: TonB-dependent receptor, partial [Burkholderiales bacterium]|nr:TonB-dependent receptor [Burkholderiales bacterium]
MRFKRTRVASAVTSVLIASFATAYADDAAPNDQDKNKAATETQSTDVKTAGETNKIEVTGIRASKAKALFTKRNATDVEEVVSAEDIGKLPDKNLADAVQRLPGVNIAKSSAGEGGFSENDRVSIRGTDPSLTQTTINGHSVATGDWFIQSQVGTVGRSVSYSLLPAEVADTVVVHKSAQADLIEGGVAGSVDIRTRTPLQFKDQLTAQATVQEFYNDLPKKSDTQFSALTNWKNDANTMGVMLQAFQENRHERRDGQEFIGYGVIQGKAGDPDAALVAAHPDLQGVRYPELINATLLQHQEKRQGGLFDFEIKPNDRMKFDVNGFFSHMDAPSYDTSFLGNPGSLITGGVVPTSYTVRNGTLVSATFPDVTPYNAGNTGSVIEPGVVDKIYRPDAASETYYVDLNGSFQATDAVKLTGQIGYTHAYGRTPGDLGYEAAWGVGGLQYNMNGINQPAVLTFPGFNTGNFNDPNVFTNASWHSIVKTTDKETYGQGDAEIALNNGMWESMKFGLRYSDHKRQVAWPADGTCTVATNPVCAAAKPTWNGQTYPSNFGSGLNPPAGYMNNYWQLDPAAIVAFENQYNPAQTALEQFQSEFTVEEKDTAAYGMADLGGAGWHGNFGLRVVHTDESSLFYVPDANGVYQPTTTKQNFVDLLPSGNLKFDLSKTLVARFAVARTMSRPSYSALSPTPTLDDLALTGSGGNPQLKPVRSNNFDASLEWYFAPRGLLSVAVFYMDMPSFITYDTHYQTLFNNTYQHNSTYNVAYPVNISAMNEGIELGYQQPLPWGFGVNTNATLANGHSADGVPLYGASKFTGNVEGYYEDDRFSARLAYTYRSSYLAGVVEAVPEYDAGTGSVDMSLNYKINKHFTVT